MAKVDQHSQPVHFAHDLDPDRAEAVELGLVGRRIGPFGGLVVRQRHVAHAEIIELAQSGERPADPAAAFHPKQRSDPSLAVGLHQGVGAGREAQGVGITVDQPARDVDLFERRAHRLVADGGAGGWSSSGQQRSCRHAGRPRLAF